MVIFGKIWPENIVILDNFQQGVTSVCPKSVPWRSNQEWRSICVDTVYTIKKHHLPRVGPKQLCALAHLGCTSEAGTS